MFKKILIANRGEIAVRIIRACRDLGIISVAVYSTADKNSLHTQIADETVCIGGARSAESYLNMDAIISAAIASGAEAIHPGFGFLSENPKFAKKCEEYGLIFIGPSYQAMEKMGDKIEARLTAILNNVPVTPGSEGEVSSIEEADKIADKIGFPLMIKAASGGGGRGIRKVMFKEDLKSMFNEAKSEAEACFGDGRVYIEKCIINPRHIEFQILADSNGKVIHLFDRDCTVQRRHQKMLEEAPSEYIDDIVRNKMGKCAIAIAQACEYENAGTVEFLVDNDRNFYFCEMNARIQVEHPVTEKICRVDLVAWQIKIANGMPLNLDQEDIKIHGHAMECRINAEDPARNFEPCPGEIKELNIPGGIGVRVDSGIYQGYTIPPYYDSMIAKIIVSGHDRNQCIARMRRALSELLFTGVITNTDYHLALLSNKTFLNGDYGTDFCDIEEIL